MELTMNIEQNEVKHVHGKRPKSTQLLEKKKKTFLSDKRISVRETMAQEECAKGFVIAMPLFDIIGAAGLFSLGFEHIDQLIGTMALTKEQERMNLLRYISNAGNVFVNS